MMRKGRGVFMKYVVSGFPSLALRTGSRTNNTWRPALAGLVLIATSVNMRAQPATWLDAYRAPAARLIHEATVDDFAWQRLAALTDTAGPRLSGSPELDRAIAWTVAELKRDGLENVHTEPVMVPKWVRGRESAELVEPAN